jgi:hypothetical protein
VCHQFWIPGNPLIRRPHRPLDRGRSARLERAAELRPAKLFTESGLHRNPLAALGAPPRNHRPTTLGLHAGAKAVRLRPLTPVRLECALGHEKSLLLIRIIALGQTKSINEERRSVNLGTRDASPASGSGLPQRKSGPARDLTPRTRVRRHGSLSRLVESAADAARPDDSCSCGVAILFVGHPRLIEWLGEDVPSASRRRR